MTDREKLIEILRVPIYPHELADPAEVVADYLLDNGVTIQKWIPVTERLPDDGDDVLAYLSDEYESRIFPANYDHGIWFDCNLNVSQSSVTHWMLIPEAPQEESHA